MWKSTMLVLSVVSTVSSYSWFRGFNSPTLNPPTSLKVGFISHEAVLVQWDFNLPANLSLNEVVFVARLDSALCIFDLYRPCWERSFKFQEFPLIRRLSALFPGTFYTFYVTATHRNWRDSQSGWISFTTRKQDWPTPELASLNRTHRNDVAEYEVRWKEFSRSKLRLLLVEVCQTNCIVYAQPPEAAVALVPMKFNTKYAIRTIAVYSEDLVGDIQRYTDYTTGVSAREPPENLLSDELRYEVEENRLKLPWHPLLPYTGPKSYYEIMVTAPSLRSTDTGALIEAEEPGFYLIPSPKIRDALEIRFEKVREYRERSRAEKAIRLNVVSRSQSVVTLRIVFMQVPESDLDAELPAKFLLLGPSVAEVFDFLHYEPIYFTVCNCLYTMKPRQTSCGNRTGYDVWSRVYVPEPVAHVGVRHREDEAIEFFWRMPEKPRGPIDGFHAWTHHLPNGLLYTLEGGKQVYDVDLHEEMTFDRYTRSFIGNKSIKTFAVAAFNIDKDDNNKKLVSKYETVAAHTTDIETSAIPFLFLAVALLAVILLPCCLLICSRLGRVHVVHEDGIQHIAMNHDPIVIVNGVLNHDPVHAEAFL